MIQQLHSSYVPGQGAFRKREMYPEGVLGFCARAVHVDAVLPNNITKLRKRAGLSQSALALAIGTTLPMMGKLERGQRPLTSRWIELIAEALEVEPFRLIAPERLFPSVEQLADMLQHAQQTLPAGLPYSEWPLSVASGLHTRLLTLADDRASVRNEDESA